MKKRMRQAKRAGAVGRLDRMHRHKVARAAAARRPRKSVVVLNPSLLKISVGQIPGAESFEDELRAK